MKQTALKESREIYRHYANSAEADIDNEAWEDCTQSIINIGVTKWFFEMDTKIAFMVRDLVKKIVHIRPEGAIWAVAYVLFNFGYAQGVKQERDRNREKNKESGYGTVN